MKKKSHPQRELTQKEIDEKLELMLNEALPTSQQERKKFMSDCAFFYVTIFKKKLQHFRLLQMEELSYLGRDDKFYDTLRSNINCFNLINKWFETMTSEHVGNTEEIRNSLHDDADFIKDLKKKL
tara:strand:- start:54 stop:428 length:375 start_codon:yes stop_codon:yes gene_type:complete